MISPSQFLNDHQWDFWIYSDDYPGCKSCNEEKPYAESQGHSEGCELAAILVEAGYEVQYRKPTKPNPVDIGDPGWSAYYPQGYWLERLTKTMIERKVKDAE